MHYTDDNILSLFLYLDNYVHDQTPLCVQVFLFYRGIVGQDPVLLYRVFEYGPTS